MDRLDQQLQRAALRESERGLTSARLPGTLHLAGQGSLMLEPTITERANHQHGAILSMFRLTEGGWVNAQVIAVVTVRASDSARQLAMT